MPEIIDWQRPPRRRDLFFLLLAVLAIVIFGGRTTLSHYVEALWFGSLGYEDVFRKTLSLQWGTFGIFSAMTFLILYGWFLALRRVHQNDLPIGSTISIGGQPLKLPVARILGLLGFVVSRAAVNTICSSAKLVALSQVGSYEQSCPERTGTSIFANRKIACCPKR
jgi:hypothetical protein